MESNSTAFLIKIKLRHSLGRPSRGESLLDCGGAIMYMVIGLCLGIAFGTALDNLPLGMAIGVAIGAGIDSSRSSKRKKDKEDEDL